MADRRQLNEVSWMRNPRGEFFIFGKVGTGKNSYITTLAFRRTKPSIMDAYRKYQGYIGTPIKDVPKDKR